MYNIANNSFITFQLGNANLFEEDGGGGNWSNWTWIKQQALNSTDLEIVREFIVTENQTTVTLTLIPHSNLTDLDYYELIPKCALALLNANALSEKQIEFLNKNFEIVEEDPLVVWHLGDLTEPLEITYVIDKALLEDCAELFEGAGLGKVNIPAKLEEPKGLSYFIKTIFRSVRDFIF